MKVSLRCTSCGQPVHRFAGCRWDEEARLLRAGWMRLHTPDARMPDKLQEDLRKLAHQLRPDGATAAYACGCSWQSVAAPKPIEGEAGGGALASPEGGARLGEAEPTLRWVVVT